MILAPIIVNAVLLAYAVWRANQDTERGDYPATFAYCVGLALFGSLTIWLVYFSALSLKG